MRRALASLSLCVLIFSSIGLAAGGDEKPKGSSGPATVDNRVKESELTTIRLTPEAERRLGIELATVERKPVARTERLPGEIMVPPGRTIIVSAPVAGLVTSPTSVDAALTVGQRVDHGSPLLRLQPGESHDGRTFIPADRISLAKTQADLTAARIEAEGQLAQARVRVEAAQVKLARADQLRQEGAGAQRAYDDARAEFDLATTQQTASKERVETLSRVLNSLETGEKSAIEINAPLSGWVRSVHIAPGQVVASGAPLAEIVALDPAWVRVPVYVGDFAALSATGSARVRALGASSEAAFIDARRVTLPESADARSATVDLFFELPNPGAALRPGERVSVQLVTASTTESLVAPYAAILFDIYGGTWVYESIGPQVFTRRRVSVRDVVGDVAVLARGLSAGAKVVTAGAAELFGTEFGVGK